MTLNYRLGLLGFLRTGLQVIINDGDDPIKKFTMLKIMNAVFVAVSLIAHHNDPFKELN